MAEYIEREATCRDCFHYDACDYHITEMTTMTVNECPHNFVDKADVVEVRRGEWMQADDTRRGQKFICSVCKGVSYYPQPTRDKNWVKHCGYSHCPHCLAKMDGKDGAE